MEKVIISNDVSWPMPIVLIGTLVGQIPNFVTVAWIVRTGTDPHTLGFTIDRNYHSAKGIEENQFFSVNFPSSNLIEKTDFCGLYSGTSVNKSSYFDVYYGNYPKAPLISECNLSLACKVIDTKDVDGDLFIKGEILEVLCNSDYVKGNKADFSKIDPLIYSDKKYHRIGDFLGNAFEIGKNLIPDVE